ncbi:hypothetical protein GCM10010215_46040 [Streptomyces virginiae]|uniref:Uncharacterized protein n=1 Tax=Streptomyces virginiae TaxID=1961 RepID=A0ABQ3NW31_STRVG|nr:hypothetical protein GCM10010215_46040 [Streptomyces virginiae]GHI16976.1 hypothetical protein Scinn_64390 [Streptomyces virginiae]
MLPSSGGPGRSVPPCLRAVAPTRQPPAVAPSVHVSRTSPKAPEAAVCRDHTRKYVQVGGVLRAAAGVRPGVPPVCTEGGRTVAVRGCQGGSGPARNGIGEVSGG